MAIGDKKPVVMEGDRGIENGIATLGADGKLADEQIPSLEKLGAAPSGFGLGSSGKYLTASDDLNSVWECGFYYWTETPVNAPFGYGIMSVSSRNTTVYVQEIVKAGGDFKNCEIRRTRCTDTINEWEWENPPMTLGVEYRTTERFNGKVVCVMLMNFGSLPNSSIKDVEHGLSGISYLRVDTSRSFIGTLNATTANLLPDNTYITELYPTINAENKAVIRIRTSADLSNRTGYICLKYCRG